MSALYDDLVSQCDLTSPSSQQSCSLGFVCSIVMGPDRTEVVLTKSFTTMTGVVHKARKDAHFQDLLCRSISNSYREGFKKAHALKCFHCSSPKVKDFSHRYFCNWKNGSLKQILAISLPYCDRPGHDLIARIHRHAEGKAVCSILSKKQSNQKTLGCPNCVQCDHTWKICAECRIQGNFTYGSILPECDLAAASNRQPHHVNFVCSIGEKEDEVYSNTFHTVSGVIKRARSDKVFLNKLCLAMSTRFNSDIKKSFPHVSCCCCSCQKPTAAFASTFFCNWQGGALKQVLALSLPFCADPRHADYAVREISNMHGTNPFVRQALTCIPLDENNICPSGPHLYSC